jgi:hypothetical protein
VDAVQSLHLPTYQGAVLEWITALGGAGVASHPDLLEAKTKLRMQHAPAGTAADGLAQI